jgi:ribosome-associated translation inhibitor RaiA
MEAIEAVLELAKERDHIAEELETYEDWFETLVGQHVTLTIKSKKHTRFVDCLVSEFVEGEGWELQSEDDDTVYVITFLDFVKGLVQVHP